MHYQRNTYNGPQQSFASSSHHYSHPYAPYGEPSQPLRTDYPSPHFATNSRNESIESARRQSSIERSGSTRSYDQASVAASGRGADRPGPIPAPTIKTEYPAPVFQTFQERKRARELALRASAGHAGQLERSVAQPSPEPMTDLPGLANHAIVPPSRSGSNTSVDGRALPIPPPIRTDARPRTPESLLKREESIRSESPAKSSTSRPLPSPISVKNDTSYAGPSTPRSPVSAFSTGSASTPILDRSDTISSVKSLDRGMGYGSPSKRSLPKPPVAVNTSRSLDRGVPSGTGGIGAITSVGLAEGYSRKTGRKLPSTVNELSEGSDDGLSFDLSRISLPKSPDPPKRPISPTKSASAPAIPTIKLPLDSADTGYDSFARDSGSDLPTMITISAPDSPFDQIVDPLSVSSDNLPKVVGPSSSSQPATFTPLPAITIGDVDDDELVTAGSGIAYGDLPMIAVSSSDVCEAVTIQVPNVHTSGDKSISDLRHKRSASPIRLDPTAAIICAGCSNAIIGRIVSAMDQRWHPQCFTCGECGDLLEHVSSYEYQGKPYCHLDYHDKFAHRCHHCKTPIVEPRFITLDDPVLGQRYYHELHFFCSECGDPFLDPSKSSAPGTERNRLDAVEEEEETSAFVIQKGHPYCERCHLRLHKPKCKGCARPIPDVAVDAMNGKWHQECFLCVECGNPFANSLFFPKDGKAFCTECYGVMIGN